MKILFAGFDLAASQNMAALANAAALRAHRVTFIGNQLMHQFSSGDTPDVIVTGLASFKTENELKFAHLARESNIPHLVVPETHFVWGRPKAKGLMDHAVCAVVSPAEVNEAKAWGYKEAVYIGGPPLWQSYFKLEPCKDIDVPEGVITILVGGIKDAKLFDMMLADVVDSMVFLAETHGFKWQMIFRPHPNEPKETKDEARRAKILEGVTLLDSPHSDKVLIPRVSASIFTSGAMGTIVAPIQRVPSIYYEDDWVLNRMNSQIGRPDWLPAEKGALIKGTPANLTEELEHVLQLSKELPEHHQQLLQKQEEVYPAPEPGMSVEERILLFIEEQWG